MIDQPAHLSQSCLISVIIPALNEEKHITNCLQAARRTYPANQVEILVANGGSKDQTCSLIPADVTLLHTPKGRAVQMNTATQKARGVVLVFCHADSQLPEGWREAVIEALNQPGVIGGTFQTKMEPAQGILRWRNKWTMPVDWRYMFGDQCQFMCRSTFDEVGGFPEQPLMEDVEMSRAMAQRGKLVRIDKRVVTSSRRLLEKGILRQTLGNYWRMICYLYFGVSAEKIARTYRSSRENCE